MLISNESSHGATGAAVTGYFPIRLEIWFRLRYGKAGYR